MLWKRHLPQAGTLRRKSMIAALLRLGGCLVSAATSGRFRHQLALVLAHECLEGLGLRAAELLDRIGHRETSFLRIEPGGAERLPERGKMFERVRIETSRLRLAAPLLVRNFFVAHVLAENPGEGRDDILQRDYGADHRIGSARRQR